MCSPLLPRIHPDSRPDAISQQNWIISAFNLTAATFLPFWAQAADIFGRHTTLQLTILLVLIGSAICTGAPTHALPALLVGRAIQGIGAAGVNISVRIILADRVSLKEYATNWSLFALVAAVGYTIGPVIGGYLTASTWRWVFAINLPVAVIAMALAAVLLRKELLGPQPLPELEERSADGGERTGRRAKLLVRLSTIDYFGQLLFLFGVGLFILALTWAGNGESGTYYWDSPEVIAPLAVGVVLTVAWFAYEYSMAPGGLMARVFRRQRAMMPWVLFQEKDISILFFVNFCYGMCMYSVMYFMSYYFQYVQGKSVSDAGTALLYFLPGLGGKSYSILLFSLHDRGRTENETRSWCVWRHVHNQQMAAPDYLSTAPWQPFFSSRSSSARLGHRCGQHERHLRHDGALGLRCRHPDVSRLDAWPCLLPSQHCTNNLVSSPRSSFQASSDNKVFMTNFRVQCLCIRASFWWSHWSDHHEHRLQQQSWDSGRERQGCHHVCVLRHCTIYVAVCNCRAVLG